MNNLPTRAVWIALRPLGPLGLAILWAPRIARSLYWPLSPRLQVLPEPQALAGREEPANAPACRPAGRVVTAAVPVVNI